MEPRDYLIIIIVIIIIIIVINWLFRRTYNPSWKYLW